MKTTEDTANRLTIFNVENGTEVVDGQYYKALKETKDIVQFNPKLIEISKVARTFYRTSFGPLNTKTITGIVFTMNRELITKYGKDQPWEEDLSILTILSLCHSFKSFTPKYLRAHLSSESFFFRMDQKEINRIVDLVFTPGWSTTVFGGRKDDVLAWKKRVMDFLMEKLLLAPPAFVIAFCGSELEALTHINRGIKEDKKKPWMNRLPPKEQMWYFNKIVEIARRYPSKHVENMMQEYERVSMEVFAWFKKEKIKPVPTS